MAELNSYDAGEFDSDEPVVHEEDALEYGAKLAEEAIQAYITQTQTKENKMSNLEQAAEEVKQETLLNAKIVSGEILLENIETLADKFVISKLNWFQKLTISKKQKEMAVTLATYAIVHAIKSGGFGLTKYRINHAALDYVTLAANQRLIKYLVSSIGIDTNLASMFLKVPEITEVKG